MFYENQITPSDLSIQEKAETMAKYIDLGAVDFFGGCYKDDKGRYFTNEHPDYPEDDLETYREISEERLAELYDVTEAEDPDNLEYARTFDGDLLRH